MRRGSVLFVALSLLTTALTTAACGATATSGTAVDGGGGTEGSPWSAASQSLVVETFGGFAPLPPADAGADCKAVGATYEYSVATGVLDRRECTPQGSTSASATLTGATKDRLGSKLAALRRVPKPSGCVADAPTAKVTVTSSAGASVYYDEFSSCSQPDITFLEESGVTALVQTMKELTP